MLQEAGLPAGGMPEVWGIEHPDILRSIHDSYLACGCDIITTNTFGANAIKLSGCNYSVAEVVSRSVSIARSAVEACGRDALVAADIGPTGKLLKPLGDLSFYDAYDAFREAAVASEKAGADVIFIETMSDTLEIKAAILAVKENTSLPVVAMMTFDANGRLLTGGDLRAAVPLLEGLRVDALGMNCGLGPYQMKPLMQTLSEISSTPIFLNPNAGLPKYIDGQTVFDVGPDEFAVTMAEIVEMGARGIGGCCGTTPMHIKRMIEKCRHLVPKSTTKKIDTVVSSYSNAVSFDDIVIIGERINPTGKPRLKTALRENDMDYILEIGISQQNCGAHILDVNVGLPEIDEPAMMEKIISELQGISPLPIQIDTSNISAMERAMRIYNGKPLINSVNGKKESMDAVFPLVRKYGGVVIALALDENGIPDTPSGRVEIIKKIIDRAASYGIEKKDIIADMLTMTVSTGADAAKTTLDAIRLVKSELGVKTSLGVSNVSFGLPRREIINSAFFTMALSVGLDAAIINPSSSDMMNAYAAFRALSGLDKNCSNYISSMSGSAPASVSSTSESSPLPSEDLRLKDAIIHGLREKASVSAKALLASTAPMDIINGVIIPALDVVGRGFEDGTIFLPQLLMSAEAVKDAFETIKPHILSGRSPGKDSRRRIILATVKGDIHDIGKNIVKVLLENYGFDVLDLGRDVDPEIIVNKIKSENIRLVGLSALMTTTVPSMAETIKLIRESGLDCAVMVGGAVMTQEYADLIGADFYGADAMAAVRYANSFFAG